MATVAPQIQSFTARQFEKPEKFLDFCENNGRPLAGIIGGRGAAFSCEGRQDLACLCFGEKLPAYSLKQARYSKGQPKTKRTRCGSEGVPARV